MRSGVPGSPEGWGRHTFQGCTKKNLHWATVLEETYFRSKFPLGVHPAPAHYEGQRVLPEVGHAAGAFPETSQASPRMWLSSITSNAACVALRDVSVPALRAVLSAPDKLGCLLLWIWGLGVSGPSLDSDELKPAGMFRLGIPLWCAALKQANLRLHFVSGSVSPYFSLVYFYCLILC